MTRLAVTLYDTLIGYLSPDNAGSFDFAAAPEAFERFSLLSPILSVAVLLSPQPSRHHARRRRNFFDELMPEGRNLTWLARQARLDEADTFGLLAHYGLDVAGALMICPEGETVAAQSPQVAEVDAKEIHRMLTRTAEIPLGNVAPVGRTSLAGVQTKILLARVSGGQWCSVEGGYPSTHIIKPAQPDFPALIYDECFCTQLAGRLGLNSHKVWIENFAGTDALVIERYDRSTEVPGGRIHQEDFNQALGARGDQKYQENGGKVSLGRIAEVLETYAEPGAITELACQLIFAVMIGNLDQHAKNLSLLHLPDETIRLAPAYDCVPVSLYEAGARMALSIDSEYSYAKLSQEILARELASWKVKEFPDAAKASEFIHAQKEAAARELSAMTPVEHMSAGLMDTIAEGIQRLS
ncbi:MAG: HipA domain-containing protein [Coriobacteriia bacterium]|nr:HipA domain-containing protein [Coriobacteriia bacterium]